MLAEVKGVLHREVGVLQDEHSISDVLLIEPASRVIEIDRVKTCFLSED